MIFDPAKWRVSETREIKCDECNRPPAIEVRVQSRANNNIADRTTVCLEHAKQYREAALADRKGGDR